LREKKISEIKKKYIHSGIHFAKKKKEKKNLL
jgi:hypothetical protein